MTDQEKEEVWEQVEQIAVDAIAKVARLLDTLEEVDKLAIYANLENIASDGIRQVNSNKQIH